MNALIRTVSLRTGCAPSYESGLRMMHALREIAPGAQDACGTIRTCGAALEKDDLVASYDGVLEKLLVVVIGVVNAVVRASAFFAG